MTKKPEKKSLDLITAQRLYIAAGQPAQAEAAGFVIDAVRNTVQGEWGQSFVGSLENLLTKYINPLGADVGGLRTDVQQWALESAARLGKLESRMDASEADRKDLRAVTAELTAKLERIERIMAERPEQREAEHQALLKAIRDNHGE